MLIDATFADWIAGDPTERFAVTERTVMSRTNAIVPRPGTWQPPWPRAWGTPPWGAKTELENSACAPGTRCEYALLRGQPVTELECVHDILVERVRPGAPALLYVGHTALPRHVALVFRDDANTGPLVYEPMQGAVLALSRARFARGRLRLGGWDLPWLLIQPSAQGAVRLPPLWSLSPLPVRARRMIAGQAWARPAGQ